MFVDIINLSEFDISHMKYEAEKEGYNIVNHLITDYVSGINKFNKDGEKLVGFTRDDTLVALCGLIEPTNIVYGRIRRFYVLSRYRNQGIGTELVNHLIEYARHYFKGVVVNIGNLSVNYFYNSIGFTAVKSTSYTHILQF